MSDINLITDELDLLNEVKECVKAVGGSVIECGYVTDKHILVTVNNPNEIEFEHLQDEINSWGNIPIKYIGNKTISILFELV